MSSNIQIVTEFMRACDGKSMDRVISFFASDCCYHNMPTEPAYGPQAVRDVLQTLADLSDEWQWQLHHIAETPSGVVLTERTDKVCVRGEWFDFPAMGVFELRNGKIHAWRDYFDLQQAMKTMQAAAQRKGL